MIHEAAQAATSTTSTTSTGLKNGRCLVGQPGFRDRVRWVTVFGQRG
jgi:hypothetical protein